MRALTRRAEVAGASAFVVRMGSEEAGAVILRVERAERQAFKCRSAVGQ